MMDYDVHFLGGAHIEPYLTRPSSRDNEGLEVEISEALPKITHVGPACLPWAHSRVTGTRVLYCQDAPLSRYRRLNRSTQS